MQNRRAVVFSLAGTLVGAPFARAFASPDAAAAADGIPKATVVPGKPPILDFGDGVRVPCSKAAFLTLWEGKTFWLTFGAGRSSYSQRAQGEAVLYASGAMKLLLLTLAFTPDRLDHVEGSGWRLKMQASENYVRGSIDLPGKPFWPITDANLGFGDADASNLAAPPTLGGYSVDPAGSFAKVNAFTAYVVLKKDAGLDDIRARAELL